ncbi:MAG TPA: DUF92 domain-containing protein [Verrucomicrobiae bacterium]|nr:DUF92 domain-containing protein [Verrucomicrobiae bacterium]
MAGVVAIVAWRARALTPGGALAAFCIGGIIFTVGGWPLCAVLFGFFLPSALLSRVGRARKAALVDVGKHGPRDAWQVLANGGVATLCALLSLRLGAPLLAACAGAFAAASADTWGTELGTLAKGAPRSLLTGKPTAPGLSGGVTWQGSLASIVGAGVVAEIAALVGIAAMLPVLAGGVAGAFADSLAGAAVQALRWCPQCQRSCETDPHVCGTSTTLQRGFARVGNDTVNLLATTVGALLAGILWASAPMVR